MKKTDEELKKILMDKFYEVYPKQSIPVWFEKYANFVFEPNFQKKVLELNVIIPKPNPLDESYSWEEISGRKTLVHTDKNTGKKNYVLINDNYTLFYVFKAYLHKSMEVEIIYNIDNISDLKEKDFNLSL